MTQRLAPGQLVRLNIAVLNRGCIRRHLDPRLQSGTIVTTMSVRKQIVKPANSPPAVGPYNAAVRAGELLFCSGQIPIDPATNNLVAGDIRVQTERVLENVKLILQDQRLDFANVIKSTVFLTDLANFTAMNEVYARYFTGDFPARSTVQVAALPKGAQIEIEVVAQY
jgi:2-iminobutanoate/2-iminopropanoate deaminase